MEAVKITKSLDYKLVFTKGTRIKSSSFNLQYLNTKASSIRFGITASKKIGNAVKRNRIKRKLKSIILKLLKINSAIDLNYVYVIFGKDKAYKEYHNSLFEKMKKSFKRMDGIKLWNFLTLL